MCNFKVEMHEVGLGSCMVPSCRGLVKTDSNKDGRLKGLRSQDFTVVPAAIANFFNHLLPAYSLDKVAKVARILIVVAEPLQLATISLRVGYLSISALI